MGLTSLSGGARARPALTQTSALGHWGLRWTRGCRGASSRHRGPDRLLPNRSAPCSAPAPWAVQGVLRWRPGQLLCLPGTEHLSCVRAVLVPGIGPGPGGSVVGAAHRPRGLRGPAVRVCLPLDGAACSRQRSRDAWVRADQGLGLAAGSVWSDALSRPSRGLGAALPAASSVPVGLWCSHTRA